MRRLVLVLFVLAAMTFAPVSAERDTDCTWGDIIMTLTHIQAQVDYHEGGDAHKLIMEADAALDANGCFSS